jgi:phosphate transport system permease protein
MSDAYDRQLVSEDTTAFERFCGGIVGISFLLFVFGLTTLFQVAALDTGILGLELIQFFGLGLTVVGVAVLGVGAASRTDTVDTMPGDTSGIGVAVGFGLIGVVVGGLTASQTFGLGLFGWLLAAAVLGGAMAAVALFTREDVGSTVLPGGVAIATGLVLLFEVIGPEWSWAPGDFSATFNALVVVAVLVSFSSLLLTWTGAKAYAGFGSRGRQNGAYLLIGLNAITMIAVLLLLVVFVFSKGWPALTRGLQIGPGLNVDIPFIMNVSQGIYIEVPGVLPAIMGTVWIIVGASLFAIPLGVGAAVFLTEYAEQGNFTRLVEITTNGLWSTPSVVFGLFGYAFLVPRFGNNQSLLIAMLVLGFMLLPLVVITSREALKSVPGEYRDASAALGVSQWQTIRSVVLPAALPGVITGVILGIGRIAGETAPLILVLGGTPFPSTVPRVIEGFEFTAAPPFVSNDVLLQSTSALPYQIYASITAGVGTEDAQAFGWGTALVLLLVVLSFYLVGILARKYFSRKLRSD